MLELFHYALVETGLSQFPGWPLEQCLPLNPAEELDSPLKLLSRSFVRASFVLPLHILPSLAYFARIIVIMERLITDYLSKVPIYVTRVL